MADGLERRLVVLMAARLGLSIASLLIALALEAAGEHFTTTEWRGFYGTIAVAFTAAVAYGLALPRVRRAHRFAAVNLVTDVGIVSALVHFSGGSDSVFTFLYVVVAVYGAMLFDRRGALASACLCAGAYGLVIFSEGSLWGAFAGAETTASTSVLVTTWAIHAGAMLVVATLATLLAEEVRRTRAALNRQSDDLWRLRNLHRRTVESLMSGLLTTDPQGRVTSFNPEAERITGLAPGVAIGRDVDTVLPGVRPLLTACGGERLGQRSRARAPYRNHRGEDLHLGIAASVLKEADGTALGHVVIFQDVTEVVEMEHELRRSERLAAVGQLSASIAHEIRNPLAAISGSTQILRSQLGAGGSPEEAGRLMNIVTRETDRLNVLITDFLSYARPGPLKPEVVNVEEAAAAVLELYRSVQPANVDVETRIEPQIAAHADPARLRQVLWNLVLNASEAMPEGGRLLIAARPASAASPQERPSGRRNGRDEVRAMGMVEIAVSDEGVGIEPDVLDHIFDPFYTSKAHGSGLGLSTVHRIVEEHGGSIHLESRVGAGTTLRVRLPRAEAPA